MPAVDQTPTFKLNLPTFDLRVWHTYVNENFSVIDSVLQHYLDIENLVGVWRNATEYHAGERAVDGQQGAIYECLLDNVSAASPTTFAQDRVSNPAYWGGFTVKEEFKGVWTNNTPYSIQDFVVSGNIYAVCLTSHTSVAAPGVFGDDAPYWIYLINLTGNVLPNIVGHGGSYIRARLDETVTEYRTPTQVRADLGIANIVTSWNTRVGDVTLNATDIANAGGVTTGGGAVTGLLKLSPGPLQLDGPTGTFRTIQALTSGSVRWNLTVANGTVESGSNVGSDFQITRCGDNGLVIDNPLTINRASGNATFGAAGNLNISPTSNNAALTLNKSASGMRSIVQGMTATVARWQLDLGNSTAEGGSNSGSDFVVTRMSDAGGPIDTPLMISRASGQATFADAVAVLGTLTVGNNTTAPPINLNGPAATHRNIQAQTGGVGRWQMSLANNGTESGSNAGSDFALYRYADNGAFLGTGLTIGRSDGAATFTANVAAATFTASGNIAANGVVTGSTSVNAPQININNAPGTFRQLQWQSNGGLRFLWQVDGTAESGSNAGSNFGLNAYSDAAANLGSVLSIVRATRVVTFAVAIVNSDRRLKTDIAPIEDALTIIEALQGVTYHRIADPEKRQIGLIAQDVREVLPEVVHESAERSEDGDALLGVDYAKIVSVLIEAVKELTERVRQLEART